MLFGAQEFSEFLIGIAGQPICNAIIHRGFEEVQRFDKVPRLAWKNYDTKGQTTQIMGVDDCL